MRLKVNDYSDGEILKIIRDWYNLTQPELAQMINKNKRTIYDYESELYTYNMKTLREIANKLNLEIIIQTKNKK